MTTERLTPVDAASATLVRGGGMSEAAEAHGVYTVECLGADGEVKWSEVIDNLVTTVGKNEALDRFLGGSAFAAWYLGLVDGGSAPSFNVADTMGSHTGWTENTSYSNSTRPQPTFNAAASGSKATTATSFSVNGTATIAGVFLTSGSAKGGSTGILYSAGSFTGGSKSVSSGDTLNVTYTASL